MANEYLCNFLFQECHSKFILPMRMHSKGRVIGLSVSLSVRPSSLSSEALVEGLVNHRNVRIQKILTSHRPENT